MVPLATNYFSPRTHTTLIRVLLCLFQLNDCLLKNKRIEQLIWGFLKTELFFIEGQCQHSGNCCKGIMLYYKGAPIENKEAFSSLQDEAPHYSRFNPIAAEEKHKIKHFDCSCLTKDNKCADYKGRPDFCRNYPVSYFLQHDRILPGCGYKVSLRQSLPRIPNQRLRDRVQKICSLNSLELQGFPR